MISILGTSKDYNTLVHKKNYPIVDFLQKSALLVKADASQLALYKTIVCEHVLCNSYQLSSINIFENLEKQLCKTLLRMDLVCQENEWRRQLKINGNPQKFLHSVMNTSLHRHKYTYLAKAYLT